MERRHPKLQSIPQETRDHVTPSPHFKRECLVDCYRWILIINITNLIAINSLLSFFFLLRKNKPMSRLATNTKQGAPTSTYGGDSEPDLDGTIGK